MAARAGGRSGGWRRHLPALLGVALLVAALLGVRQTVRKLDLASVSAALAAIPSAALVLAFAWTLASYAIMALYDRLGTLYAGARVGFGRTALASFTAYALSHNLGFAAVSGAAVRYRLYAQWGVPAAEIARIVAFCSITFGLGGLTLGGAILLGAPHAVPALGALLPAYALRLLGAVMLALVGAYATLSRSLGSIRVLGQEFVLPGLRLALAQIGIAAADVAVTAAILHALLPPAPGLSFAHLLALYLAAYAAGLTASLPGGIGVFDGALLLGLSPYLGAPEILGAILVFRLYYYVIPLLLAGLAFAANEVLARLGRRGPARTPERAAGRAMVRAPDFAAAAATGLVALVGALLVGIDVVAARLPPGRPIRGFGLSHLALLAGDFLPSLIGAGLMILSLGLSRRVRLAWSGTLALLGIAFLLTLAQGLSLFIPAALALAALLLAPLRTSFYRDVKLFADPLRASNAVPMFALAVCLMLLASLARREPGFAAASLWHLLTDPATAPQSRLGIGLTLALGLAGLFGLLRPGSVRALPWDDGARERYAALGGRPPRRADGLLLGEAGRAGLALLRRERVLLGLGEPAGAAADQPSLLWRLRDLAAEESRHFALWGVGEGLAARGRDLGLIALPLGPGETAPYLLCHAATDLAALLADRAAIEALLAPGADPGPLNPR